MEPGCGFALYEGADYLSVASPLLENLVAGREVAQFADLTEDRAPRSRAIERIDHLVDLAEPSSDRGVFLACLQCVA